MAIATIKTKSGDTFEVVKDQFVVDYDTHGNPEEQSERTNSNRQRDFTNAVADIFAHAEEVTYDGEGRETGRRRIVGHVSGYTKDGKTLVLVSGDDIESITVTD